MEALAGIGVDFNEAMAALYESAANAGLTLLQLTATIQFIWILYDGILSRSIDGFIETAFRAMVTVTIFAGLIRGVPQIVDQVLTFFGSAGGDAERATLNPIALVGTGLTAARQLIESAGILDAFFLGAVGILIVIFFVAMATMVLLAIIESYFVGVGAAVTFGLGGMQLSRDTALSGFRTILGIGMKIFLMRIIVSLVETPVKDLVESFDDNDAYVVSDALWVMGGAIFGAAIMYILPQMAQVMISGHGNMNMMSGAMSAVSFGTNALGKLGGTIASGIEKGVGAAKLAGAAREASQLAAGSSDGGGGGRFAASSAGIAARAIAHSAVSRIDGTGPRHGSRLWNAAANVSRANQMTKQDNERQVEQKQKQVQERREGAADASRKQTTQSVRGMQQEKRDQAYAQKRIGGSGSANHTNQRQVQQQKERDAMRAQETERREQAAQDGRKRTAAGVRAAQQEKRDQVQQDRVTHQKQKPGAPEKSGAKRPNYVQDIDRMWPRR